jgi:hypothetical protein
MGIVRDFHTFSIPTADSLRFRSGIGQERSLVRDTSADFC